MKNLKLFWKFYWVRIVIFSVLAILLVSLIIVLIVGIGAFNGLESFYKQMTLASVPLQLYLSIITAIIFASIYMGSWFWFMSGGMGKMGQAQVKPQDVNIKWNDVVGMQSPKREAEEVINLIKDRAQLKRVGGKIIKGILMVGPPGCGKTYLAKAIATETRIPFLAAVGSEFMGIFVGVGSSKIRSLFKQARLLAEFHGGCLVFIDEIDTVARPRVSVSGHGAGMDYNATVNQLLTELDGLRQGPDNNIVVIAATNVSEDELDPALMRAGRFDRKIYIGKPNLNDREKLFDYYLNKAAFDPSIDVKVLAKRTVGFTPADVANMVREASLVAVRNKHEQIEYKDLSEAYDRVVFGLKSEIILSDKDKKWTAYHEAGHAIIAYLSHPSDDVIKASIVPRKGALGYVGHRPKEEMHTQNREWFLANIKICLGSFVAEKLIFNTTSSGVEVDFAYAMQYAHQMVWRWGMGDSGILGNFYALGSYSPWSTSGSANISEKTKERLDEDTQAILKQCINEVSEILTREKALLEYFAKQLLEKGELEYDEIVEVFKKHGKERPENYPV